MKETENPLKAEKSGINKVPKKVEPKTAVMTGILNAEQKEAALPGFKNP